MCFITFLAIYQGKFGFGKFQQKLGLPSDPLPLVGPNAQLFPKINFDGSPESIIKSFCAQSDIDPDEEISEMSVSKCTFLPNPLSGSFATIKLGSRKDFWHRKNLILLFYICIFWKLRRFLRLTAAYPFVFMETDLMFFSDQFQ